MPQKKEGDRTLTNIRTRGAKPHDPQERAARVTAAVRALERIGAAFTVADVAERAGISRATLYRSPALRALVGAKGDGPRTVDAAVHAQICERHTASKARARALRRQLAEMETSWDAMRERAVAAEKRLEEALRRVQALEAVLGQTAGRSSSPVAAVAARLGPEDRRRARRQLARALHPDLFAQDSAAAALATELLKTVNALAE